MKSPTTTNDFASGEMPIARTTSSGLGSHRVADPSPVLSSARYFRDLPPIVVNPPPTNTLSFLTASPETVPSAPASHPVGRAVATSRSTTPLRGVLATELRSEEHT